MLLLLCWRSFRGEVGGKGNVLIFLRFLLVLVLRQFFQISSLENTASWQRIFGINRLIPLFSTGFIFALRTRIDFIQNLGTAEKCR